MKIMKHSIKVLFISLGIMAAASAKANRSELISAIKLLADQLYCSAEVCGGGKNGEEYQKIITEHVKNFKILLNQNQSSINEVDGSGITVLMQAADYHQYEIIELLLQAGADISITDKQGRTALDYTKLRSSARGIAAIVRLIMSGYYTKDRHNKCIKLLTKNTFKRIWNKRWTSL